MTPTHTSKIAIGDFVKVPLSGTGRVIALDGNRATVRIASGTSHHDRVVSAARLSLDTNDPRNRA